MSLNEIKTIYPCIEYASEVHRNISRFTSDVKFVLLLTMFYEICSRTAAMQRQLLQIIRQNPDAET